MSGGKTIGHCGSCKADVYHDGERWRHSANDGALDQPCPTVPNPRIGLDDDGTLDDFYATGVQSVHFEAIDESAWYANIHMDDGRIWQLNFGAKNSRAHGYAKAERAR